MSIKDRVTRLADRLGIGLFDPPIPGIAVTLRASELANRVVVADDDNVWNDYRLVEVDGTRPRAVNGDWPLITSVTYLPQGEDDRPTVYISSEDDQCGSFPVELDSYVTVVPPPGGGDIIL